MTVATLNQLTTFPNPDEAEDTVGGLLAIGGDLSPERLLEAYRNGVFPWFEDDAEPILWWSPDPRAVIEPHAMRVTSSLAKRLRNGGFTVTFDEDFQRVVGHCAEPRRDQPGTWITRNMQNAYVELHELGFAHSVEVWHDEQLVGGLYGLSLGEIFFGESMFSLTRDASKIAFHGLCEKLNGWQFRLIDCQIPNDHLTSLGVQSMPRSDFLALLKTNDETKTRRASWSSSALEHADAG
jgi:leucyl/phenylalanyl-tRNA--protein transferase